MEETIATFFRENPIESWTKKEMMTRLGETDTKQVVRTLNALCGSGAITKTQQGNVITYRSNTYLPKKILFEVPAVIFLDLEKNEKIAAKLDVLVYTRLLVYGFCTTNYTPKPVRHMEFFKIIKSSAENHYLEVVWDVSKIIQSFQEKKLCIFGFDGELTPFLERKVSNETNIHISEKKLEDLFK